MAHGTTHCLLTTFVAVACLATSAASNSHGRPTGTIAVRTGRLYHPLLTHKSKVPSFGGSARQFWHCCRSIPSGTQTPAESSSDMADARGIKYGPDFEVDLLLADSSRQLVYWFGIDVVTRKRCVRISISPIQTHSIEAADGILMRPNWPIAFT